MISVGGVRGFAHARRALLVVSTVLSSGVVTPAVAQTLGSISSPPVRRPIDANGVDVLRLTYNIAQTDITIGGSGHHGLSYTRLNIDGNFTSSQVATIGKVGTVVTVTVDNESDDFNDTGSGYTPVQGNGGTLVYSGGIYIYTTRSGVVARFDPDSGYYYSVYQAGLARVRDITWPDGTKQTYTYKMEQYCGSGIENGSCPGQVKYIIRLQSVNNSNGYQLKFSYSENGSAIYAGNYRAWAIPSSVKAINNAIDYCLPAADTCTTSASWPTANYSRTVDASSNATDTVTDAASRTTTYYKGWPAGPLTVKRPGSSTNNINVAYDPSTYVVTSVTRDGVTYVYSYYDSGTTRTTTVTDPNGGQKVWVGDTSTNLISSYRDELLRTTSYTYDGAGHVLTATLPGGNVWKYTYDARGNVTEKRVVAKAGSGLSDIVETASYPASCSNPASCNKPTYTIDARGNQTDYAYDPTTGLTTSITAPAPTAGAVRPQTRYGYSTNQAYFKTSAAGSPVASGVATIQLTSVSQCQSTASCAGGADEVKTSVGYGPQSAGTANNLLPVSISQGSGDGALVATTATTWDTIGNPTYVDGPLPGAADTTRTIYDAVRQVVGVIGPDPDGGGPLKNRAQRISYRPDGQVSLTEVGTTAGQTDAAWGGFAALQQQAINYDGNSRPTSQSFSAGGTTFGVSQVTYDALGRTDCQAVRLNSAAWGSLPGSACTLQATGGDGPDRIVKASYTAASEILSLTSAYGTADAANDVSYTYTLNGKVATAADGKGNSTAYAYDGFDRPSRTCFQVTTSAACAGTPADYEQLGYDAGGNVLSRRLRDGKSISFGYDALNRRTATTFNNPVDVTDSNVSYSYNALGRLLLAQDSNGHIVGYTYDALGRALTEVGAWGTLSRQYDLAGRRTRLTWSDGFFVTYDYDTVGGMTAIHENGGFVLASYGYDDLGRRASRSLGNGTSTSYGYDGASRLTALNLNGGAQSNAVTFGYNAAGQITSRTASNDGFAWTGAANVDRSYTVNGLNQYTASGSVTPTYDGRGNLTSAGGASYLYNSKNQLSGANGTYIYYDPAGRIDQVTQSALAWDWDGNALVAERQGGGIAKRYVFGPGTDEPIVAYSGAGTGSRNWLDADERGSIVRITDDAGNIVKVNSYDEYGIPNDGSIGRFRYTGQIWLSELGFQYSKARMYSPTLGRFMQTDPIGYGDGMNWYNYVGSDPINNIDPTGMDKDADTQTKRIEPPDIPDIIANGDRCRIQDFCRPYKQDSFPDKLNPGIQPPFFETVTEDVTVTAKKPQKNDAPVNKALQCAAAFGENLLNNFIDPVSTAEGIAGAVGGLLGGALDASIGSSAPAGGIVNIGGRSLKLAQVGVGKSAIRIAGTALRGFALGYVATATVVAGWQASQDKRCK